MRKQLRRFAALVLAALLCASVMTACAGRQFDITPSRFHYHAAGVPNPMKGFVNFYEKAERDAARGRKPDPNASLEYVGIKFSDIYTVAYGEGSIEKNFLDPILQSVSDRGNQAILRVYLFNPDDNTDECHGLFLPEELYARLKSAGVISSNQYQGHMIEYPDFNNEVLMDSMTDFIHQFGVLYDGNPSIAAVQMGLYGSWGEWNMSGCSNAKCVMTDDNLSKIIAAYTEYFRSTKLMGRNPSLGHAYDFDIGYHDDNFLFNSSDYHRQNPEWKALMKKCHWSYAELQQFYDFMNGQNGQYEPLWEQWQTQMFGGELSGMLYQDPFGTLWNGVEREALNYCVKQFHVSWLMGVGRDGIPASDSAEYEKYLEVAASFGYDIAIESVEAKNRTGKLVTTFTNHGVAPFYYDWTPEYWVMDGEGSIVATWQDVQFRLSQLLPDEETESVFFLPEDLEKGEYKVYLRFVNPAEKVSKAVKPLRLSNDNIYREGIYELANVTVQ